MRHRYGRLDFLKNITRSFAFFARDGRLLFFILCIVFFGVAILGRLWVLQVLRHSDYLEIQARRDAGLPTPAEPRGRILASDKKTPGETHPLAVDQDVFTVR